MATSFVPIRRTWIVSESTRGLCSSWRGSCCLLLALSACGQTRALQRDCCERICGSIHNHTRCVETNPNLDCQDEVIGLCSCQWTSKISETGREYFCVATVSTSLTASSGSSMVVLAIAIPVAVVLCLLSCCLWWCMKRVSGMVKGKDVEIGASDFRTVPRRKKRRTSVNVLRSSFAETSDQSSSPLQVELPSGNQRTGHPIRRTESHPESQAGLLEIDISSFPASPQTSLGPSTPAVPPKEDDLYAQSVLVSPDMTPSWTYSDTSSGTPSRAYYDVLSRKISGNVVSDEDATYVVAHMAHGPRSYRVREVDLRTASSRVGGGTISDESNQQDSGESVAAEGAMSNDSMSDVGRIEPKHFFSHCSPERSARGKAKQTGNRCHSSSRSDHSVESNLSADCFDDSDIAIT